MSRRQLTLQQAAESLGIEPGQLKTLVVHGEIFAEERRGTYVFQQEDLDLWYSKRLIHGETGTKKGRWPVRESPATSAAISLVDLCPPECISANLPGISRNAIIRALTELADQSGFLYDPEDLCREITRREELGSTNVGNGIAIPHTLTRDEGYFSESFICLARLAKPSYFNTAPDDTATDILILSCALTSEEHLAILARIGRLCRETPFAEAVRAAENAQEIREALCQSEAQLDGRLPN